MYSIYLHFNLKIFNSIVLQFWQRILLLLDFVDNWRETILFHDITEHLPKSERVPTMSSEFMSSIENAEDEQ